MLTFKQFTVQVAEGNLEVGKLIANHVKRNFYKNTALGQTIVKNRPKINKVKKFIKTIS